MGLGLFPVISEMFRYSGKYYECFLMPSFSILESSVVGLRPKSLAAPFGPLMRQLVASNVLMMCSRSMSSRVEKGTACGALPDW